MNKYLVVFTVDVGDADYVKSNCILDAEGLKELKEEILAVKRIRKSFSDHPTSWSCYRTYTESMIYYCTIRDILYRFRNFRDNLNKDLKAFIETLSKEDIDRFLLFDGKFPYSFDEDINTVISIEVYELANSETINLI